MNVFRNAGKLLATLIFVLAICAVANAQTSTFVASTGSDASAGCPRTAPCRTFQVAVNTVLPGGTVIALDSAGYGTLAIAKSVSIFAPSGVNAAVNATSGTAISVTAGTVSLFGLQINGSGTATNGISVSGGTVNVSNCAITQFGKGVFVTAGEVNLEGCVLSNNTVAARAEGTGPETTAPGTNPAKGPAATLVRISHGVIADNGTAFQQHNAGTRVSGACNGVNIFLRQSDGFPNIVGNPTFNTVTGTSDINAGCGGFFNIGGYAPQTQ